MFTWTAGQAQEQVCPPPPHCKSRERTTCRPWCPSCSRPPSSTRPPRCPHRRPGSPRPSRCRQELLPSPLRCYFRSIAPHLDKTLVWFTMFMLVKVFHLDCLHHFLDCLPHPSFLSGSNSQHSWWKSEYWPCHQMSVTNCQSSVEQSSYILHTYLAPSKLPPQFKLILLSTKSRFLWRNE